MASGTSEELPTTLKALETYLDTQDSDPWSVVIDHVPRYLRQDKLDLTVFILRNYIAMVEEEFGDREPQAIWALKRCAILLARNGEYGEQEVFLRELIPREEEHFGTTNEQTRLTSRAFGFCLIKTGRLEEARGILKDLLEESKLAFREKDPQTLETTAYYLQSLLKCRRCEQAEFVYESCLELIQSVDSDDSHDVKTKLLDVGFVLLDQGQCSLGQDIMCQVLERQWEMFGPEHPESDKIAAYAFGGMLDVLREQNGLYGAMILRNWWDGMKTILGESYKYSISALDMLGDVLWSVEEHEEMLTISRRVFDMRRQTLGDDHADTISAQETLRCRLAALGHPEAMSITGGKASGQTDVVDDTDSCARSTVARAEEGSDGEALDRDKAVQGNENTDQLCRCCARLNPVFHLERAQVYTELDGCSYTGSDQTAEALLLEQTWPLCRLVRNGISTKLQISLPQLDSNTRIAYQYVFPEGLSHSADESRFINSDIVSLSVGVLNWRYPCKARRGACGYTVSYPAMTALKEWMLCRLLASLLDQSTTLDCHQAS